ncbi:MAG: RNA methyltransferase [Oscillospiraceae bacterium]|jgi:TrmH family RNA methyltransferase|nr:RNA methyltransferase [Oscillospiraceae bacterium]
MVKITSRESEKIKQIVKLQSSAKERRRSGLFVIEGFRLCHDALSSGARIRSVYFAESAHQEAESFLNKSAAVSADKYDFSECFKKVSRETRKQSTGQFLRQAQTYILPDGLFQKIADTENPQGILLICEIAKCVPEVKRGGRFLLLENISNPQNLGTIARSAEAFGMEGLFLSENCCDVFSPKAMRAAMGAFFRLPFETVELEAVCERLKSAGIPTFAAIVADDALPVTRADFSAGAGIAIGNEGAGLTDALTAACTRTITVPMVGRAESLNAAAAAAVLMWESRRSAL